MSRSASNRPVIQHSSDASGDIITVVVSETSGPVVAGSGSVTITHASGTVLQFSGDGFTFVAGNHSGRPVVKNQGPDPAKG